MFKRAARQFVGVRTFAGERNDHFDCFDSIVVRGEMKGGEPGLFERRRTQRVNMRTPPVHCDGGSTPERLAWWGSVPFRQSRLPFRGASSGSNRTSTLASSNIRWSVWATTVSCGGPLN